VDNLEIEWFKGNMLNLKFYNFIKKFQRRVIKKRK
jgi:hypothetical protein